jgi:hypothetical protein
MAALGTMPVFVVSRRKATHSCPAKKNSFERSVLNFPGIVTGPLTV